MSEEKKQLSHKELFNRAVEIKNAMNDIFQGEHIESIGNGLLLMMTEYLHFIPEDARKIFIDGLIETINNVETSIRDNRAEH